ncbi:PPK2 family polyphosphate kinase [Ileibacterium valens]|uniref:Polyphosphate kinase-2-related domain-containing protein n=2 Tax=Ileibacterium valens TaxID=1862668 RepID=A0A1U7NG37_9FIRM|nr:PPK2 family polyphosphate kinase [Ileibacterium valens]OLU39772.1 hypothetical protein BO222_06155 [Ileibacterium valens]OLU40339.1 hypothetical protein BM735_05665 [Erysipelotrichaceae bacterium NYU-BL-F16]OLU40564.1 hypothetical protein BO224_05240 [Erysipelotrichaceae bacterium NYU-BL-E8]
MIENYRYDGSDKLNLSKTPTSGKKLGLDRETIEARTASNQIQIQQLQDKLYADQKEGLIIIIQARDAAGKDGTIKHVMSGINPQGVDVYSFKSPTHEELAHDFLWRFNRAIPIRGKIAIFNRSYYEDVLIVKVRELWKSYNVPDRMKKDSIIEKRYDQIHDYENYLYSNGYRIIKIFLNVSAKEQKERFLERINEPEKNWKFSEGDIAERGLWKEYTEAYESAINNTATKKNPWYVIPADQKWFARYLVSEVILSVMEDMDPQYPVLSADKKAKLQEYKEALENEKTISGPDGFQASNAEDEAASREVSKK